MDFHLKQCRNQHESEQQQPEPTTAHASALPLFVPHSNTKTTSTIMSALFPDSPPSSTTFPGMWGGYFSIAQRQELELQALIFRYMLAGAAVPPQLLHPIKKSLLTSTPFLLHNQHYPQYSPSWYWGRASMDPEPGRCRRTDGKKWRCSRDVVPAQKYCERHMHRGRNRSRKPVETTTINSSTTTAGGGGSAGCHPSSDSNRVGARTLLFVESGNYFSLSGQSPSVDLLHLNQGQGDCSDSISKNNNLYESQTEAATVDGKSDGRVLRHFFDDWPRSLQQSENGGNNSNGNQQMISNSASATSLSISIPGNPSSSSSDVSLKLSTGSAADQVGDGSGNRDQVQLNWAAGWAATQMASMGGPLAEALRSANNHSSPTSVLHQLPRASGSEVSFIST